jgi:hypothetical protein
MASQDTADKHANLVERAVRTLDLALCLAAEADLHLTLNVYRQDLQGNSRRGRHGAGRRGDGCGT